MSLYAVIREAGPGWTDGKGAFEQPGVNDHGAFMNELAGQGFVLFAGPLAGSEHGRIRALLIVDAADEEEIGLRLASDPWADSRRLVTATVEPWTLLVGSERLAAPRPPER